MRGRYRLGNCVEFPHARAVQCGYRVVDAISFPRTAVAIEQVADLLSGLCPGGKPRFVIEGTAERPQKSDGLIKRRQPVPPEHLELAQEPDQPVGGERIADLNGKSEPPEQSADRCLATAELACRQRTFPREEPMSRADDRLRVVTHSVMHEQILPGTVEPITLQEAILAEVVVLPDRLEDRIPRDLAERHSQSRSPGTWGMA